MHDTHVFVGPSLPLKTAFELFPKANYHPPVQCGDIIRLLRLKPKTVVIIDGLYETTPAVWHKELLLALEKGIEVWGAASMGALRAAELHHYGMKGFGQVFADFKQGILTDDDEVAVLHQSPQEGYAPINDAMVNIRATCIKAWEQGILTLEAKDRLISYCKKQFYPYRALAKATETLIVNHPHEYLLFAEWLKQHQIIDVKRNDAVDLLSFLSKRNAQEITQTKQELGAMTCFLRELILFANTTPFRHDAEWLPKQEQELHQLHKHAPKEYMLLAELVSLLQKLAVFNSPEHASIDNKLVLEYINKNQLYCPADEFALFKDHPLLCFFFPLICQSIAQLHLREQQIKLYIPALAHYYDLSEEQAAKAQKKLRLILVLIYAINQQVKQSHLTIAKTYVRHHLKQLKNWRQYSSLQMKAWLTPPTIDRALFSNVLKEYLMASSVHALSSLTIEYYEWLYDAKALCEEELSLK